MQPGNVLRTLTEDDRIDDVYRKWSESEENYSRDRYVFPAGDELTRVLEYCDLESDMYPRLISVAMQTQSDDALHRLAWHCRWRLAEDKEPAELRRWPLLTNALGENGGVFYLLAGLSVVPYIRRYHASFGIPENVTRDTCRIIRSFCDAYRIGHEGIPGIQRTRISWLRHYSKKPLYRIEGLEYWIRENPIPLTMFRNRNTRQTVVLMWDNEPIDEEGFPAGAAGGTSRWATTYEESESSVTGNPVRPSGRVLHETVTLNCDAWSRVVGFGDPVLQLHFPHGANITLSNVRHSFLSAIDFFRLYFEEMNPVAVVGESWVFSPILESLIGSESRAVRLQKELYISPGPPGTGGFSFIFPEDGFNGETARSETRLQRAIINHLHQGKQWRTGEMTYLIEDIETFGTRYYLRQFEKRS